MVADGENDGGNNVVWRCFSLLHKFVLLVMQASDVFALQGSNTWRKLLDVNECSRVRLGGEGGANCPRIAEFGGCQRESLRHDIEARQRVCPFA